MSVLIALGVWGFVALIFSIPFWEELFLPKELLAPDGDDKRFQNVQSGSGSSVPTVTVVELASKREQLKVLEKVQVQKKPIPLAA